MTSKSVKADAGRLSSIGHPSLAPSRSWRTYQTFMESKLRQMLKDLPDGKQPKRRDEIRKLFELMRQIGSARMGGRSDDAIVAAVLAGDAWARLNLGQLTESALQKGRDRLRNAAYGGPDGRKRIEGIWRKEAARLREESSYISREQICERVFRLSKSQGIKNLQTNKPFTKKKIQSFIKQNISEV